MSALLYLSRFKTRLMPIAVFGLASFFFIYEWFLQVSPSVISHQLMRDLAMSAAGLGTMSAAYYCSYTPTQLFAGMFYDRFGPRLLLTFSVLFCALGAYLFGHATTMSLGAVGRFSMGFGSAFAFIGCLILASRWFPPQYFAFLAGVTQLMGAVGAIGGAVPLAIIIKELGWRQSLVWASVVGVILGALIWILVRDWPADKSPYDTLNTERKMLQGLKQVCQKSQTWVIGVYSFAIWAPMVAFPALWGIPFLSRAYHLTTEKAAAACSMIWIGTAIGSPLIGAWSDIIKQRRMPLLLCAFLGLLTTGVIIYMPGLPMSVLYVLLFGFGFAASGQALSFAVVKDNNTPCLAGTAIGVNNMAVVAGGALFQPLVGVILRANWQGEMVDAVPFYSLGNYQGALFILPLAFTLALVVSVFLLRESYCNE